MPDSTHYALKLKAFYEDKLNFYAERIEVLVKTTNDLQEENKRLLKMLEELSGHAAVCFLLLIL
jgi:hypothetical protein